ncbi:MAG: hypothetical protein KKE64_07875 [Candidatus Omnitrophica bacterium]|nr:hypothetical protein [Candidatus Omnitrophota bacterium]
MCRGVKFIAVVFVFFIILTLTISFSLAQDRNNNPPGPKGGPGTNWENKPGPQGGPGTSSKNLRERTRVNEGWEKAADTNQDGVVDDVEIRQWRQRNAGGSLEQQEGNGPGDNFMNDRAVVDRGWERATDTNRDGIVDQTEAQQWRQRVQDRDNNPPGPKGGPGTNWENKPGPQGGPGVSPNRRSSDSGQGGGKAPGAQGRKR